MDCLGNLRHRRPLDDDVRVWRSRQHSLEMRPSPWEAKMFWNLRDCCTFPLREVSWKYETWWVDIRIFILLVDTPNYLYLKFSVPLSESCITPRWPQWCGLPFRWRTWNLWYLWLFRHLRRVEVVGESSFQITLRVGERWIINNGKLGQSVLLDFVYQKGTLVRSNVLSNGGQGFCSTKIDLVGHINGLLCIFLTNLVGRTCPGKSL